MELIMSLAVGVLFGSGVWLILRPRSFQVITGLMLLSYAVNLFIFLSGHLSLNKPAFVTDSSQIDVSAYADPLPQSLVLTAIVIGFATSALYLVVMLASRGLSGTDHVDGTERGSQE